MSNNDVTLLYTNRNNYNIFRLTIETMLEYIPKDQYKEILIVDDCSNEEELLNFLKYLNDEHENIRVIYNGEKRDYSWYNWKGGHIRGPGQWREVLKTEPPPMSYGHGHSMNVGIENAKTKYLATIDSDTIMLPRSKDVLSKMIECFKLDDKILVVGPSAGRLENFRIVDKPFPYDGPVNESGGKPHACFMICDMDSWNVHGMSKMDSAAGWAHTYYLTSIYTKGFKTCNFNVFKDGYAIHIGYSCLRLARKDGRPLGMVSNGFYGKYRPHGSDVRDWYAGYYSLDIDTKSLMKFLDNEYVGFPFDKRKNVLKSVFNLNKVK